MLMRILKSCLQTADAASVPKKPLRRGATAMEYLVAISFILIVLILAVQHVGKVTGGLLGNSAKATKFSGS